MAREKGITCCCCCSEAEVGVERRRRRRRRGAAAMKATSGRRRWLAPASREHFELFGALSLREALEQVALKVHESAKGESKKELVAL
jgi:hypothetical protein